VIKGIERPTHGPQGLGYAAAQAVVSFISDNEPDELDDGDLRHWRGQRMAEQARLDSAWTEHTLRLGRGTVGARIQPMDNGYCLVADAGDAFLAIAARHFPHDLALVLQDEVTKIYRR
jgi:hypothetical protein